MPTLASRLSVFVIDDEQEVLESVKFRIRAEGLDVQAFDSAESFLADSTPKIAGCIVTDVRLPRMDGVSLISAMAAQGIRLPVIVISGFADTPLVVEAMQAGAVNFLEKPLDSQALVDAVRYAMNDTSSASSLRMEMAGAARRLLTLSPRERAVFDGLAGGSVTKRIATELGISPKTVETYRSRLIEKLDLKTPHALMRMTVLATLLPPSTEPSGDQPA